MAHLVDLASPTAQESCRSDYMTLTYKLSSRDDEEDLFAYLYDFAEKVLPTGEFDGPHRGRHYERSYSHRAGVNFEMSPLDSDKISRGYWALSVSGRGLGALDAKERCNLIYDLRNWPGFKRCTRWDPQITVLNPQKRVDEIVDDVREGNLWSGKMQSSQVYERRDHLGGIKEPPTQYFGSASSNIRLRVYDHGAMHGWETPSLRVEAQMRKAPADQHFRRLAERLTTELEYEPLFLSQEALTVKQALQQHADFRDTSKWAGRKKPEKWRQSAPVPSWWTELLQVEADPLAISHKPEVTWVQAMESMFPQYGRKLVLFVIHTALKEGKSHFEVMDEVLCRAAAYVKLEDASALADALPDEDPQLIKRLVRQWTDAAARHTEGHEPRPGQSDPLI